MLFRSGDERVAIESGGTVTAFADDRAPMWWRIVRARRAAKVLARQHPRALLVSHFAPYGLGLALVRDRRRQRFIVHFHGPWSAESRAEGHGALSFTTRRALERFVYRRADACIVLSKAFGELLREEFGVHESRIYVIPGGVDTARFAISTSRVDARKALGWPIEGPTVLAVRRLVRRMGLDRLIDAAPVIAREIRGVRIVIAGDGVEREALLARIRERGVQDIVTLAGRLSDEQLPLAYRAADLTIVPSVALEGFGLIVPESLAAGTPALVTPVGGLPEVVRDLSPALVLAESDVGSVAQGIIEALEGRRTLPSALACATFARERYDWSIVTRRTAELYRQYA